MSKRPGTKAQGIARLNKTKVDALQTLKLSAVRLLQAQPDDAAAVAKIFDRHIHRLQPQQPGQRWLHRLWISEQTCKCTNVTEKTYCEHCRRPVCGQGCLACDCPAKDGCGFYSGPYIPE